jgi:hypothetical protein
VSRKGWLQELFCADLRRELDKAQSTIEDLENKLGESESAYKESEDQYSELHADYTAQKDELDRLKVAYNDAIKALSNAVEIPDISKFLEQAVDDGSEKKVDPPNLVNPATGKMYGLLYDVETSDNIYFAYDEGSWRQVLDLIHPEVKKVVGFGSSEIADCDNYAYTTAVFTALAFNKAGKRYQGAIGVAEGHYDPEISTTHAFNVVVLEDDRMFSYEPYSNKWLGDSDTVNTGSLKYKVRKINFSN